ncbi:hypothetical protein TNCV_3059191 [Trichonephila clavipes]|nr:hypothetical protein TNCV_3059191 [Trichonephila clavipes]
MQRVSQSNKRRVKKNKAIKILKSLASRGKMSEKRSSMTNKHCLELQIFSLKNSNKSCFFLFDVTGKYASVSYSTVDLLERCYTVYNTNN